MKPDHRTKSLIDVELNHLRSVMLYDASLQPLQTKPHPPNPEPQIQSLQPNSEPQIQALQPNPEPQIQALQPNPEPEPELQALQPNPEPQIQALQPAQPSNDNWFRPAFNQDPLFWCLYIMMRGKFKYDQLPNRFTAEQDGKRDQVMMLRERAKQLKQSTGIKFAASTIESDIMSQRISLHAFQVLVYLNSLNAVFVNHENRVYAEFISDAVTGKPVYIIERNIQNPKQMTMKQVTEAQLVSVRATNYLIENPQKPIKSASAYTVPVLTEMCHQLKLPLNPKMKKQELYDAVTAKLVL